MKILHVSTSSSGGAAIAANRLHIGLLNEEFDSSILYLHKNKVINKSYEFPKKDINLVYKILRKLNLYQTTSEKNTLNTSTLSKEKTMFSFADSDYDITKTQIYHEADIINLHWVSDFIDFKSFFKNNTKPLVWTLHDQNPFTGGCHYSENCDKYSSNCHNCYLWKNKESLVIATEKNFLLKQTALSQKKIAVVAPSKWLHNLSLQSTLFGKQKHYHIPYGLDTNVYFPINKSEARQAFSISDDKKVLLFISDKLFEERKGFKILKEAISIINRDDVHLLAIGKENESDSNLKIQYTGHINDETTMNLAYNAADAFILPSLQDNLPNTMLEALSCGTPVIAFPVGGIIDCIKTGENGILANKISVEALSIAISEFLNGGFNFSRDLIREFAAKEFDQKKQALSYSKLYKQLLD